LLKFKLWSDFISRSGQEQDEIIEYAEKLLMSKQHNKQKFKSNLRQFTEHVNEKYNLKEKRLRKSSSDDFIQDYFIVNDQNNHQNDKIKNVIGKYLFTKIDKNIRDVFKRSFSHEKLCELEDIILNTFTNSPDSIYISKLPESFDRMVLHGICQYFSLSSKSKSLF
jgi:signal transduction histidine kinase